MTMTMRTRTSGRKKKAVGQEEREEEQRAAAAADDDDGKEDGEASLAEGSEKGTRSSNGAAAKDDRTADRNTSRHEQRPQTSTPLHTVRSRITRSNSSDATSGKRANTPATPAYDKELQNSETMYLPRNANPSAQAHQMHILGTSAIFSDQESSAEDSNNNQPQWAKKILLTKLRRRQNKRTQGRSYRERRTSGRRTESQSEAIFSDSDNDEEHSCQTNSMSSKDEAEGDASLLQGKSHLPIRQKRKKKPSPPASSSSSQRASQSTVNSVHHHHSHDHSHRNATNKHDHDALFESRTISSDAEMHPHEYYFSDANTEVDDTRAFAACRDGDGTRHENARVGGSSDEATTFLQRLWNHFNIETTGKEEQEAKVEEGIIGGRVWGSLKLIGALEQTLFFGGWMCFDMLFDMICIVPVKAAISVLYALRAILLRKPIPLQFIVKMLIILAGFRFMEIVDLSYMYHNIRSQSTIKLYVLVNMCEVFDKLLSTFAQDATDAVVLKATNCRGLIGIVSLIPFLLISVFALLAHTVVVLLQMIALNVAINSFSSGILTILMSNQFLEVKSTVFKRLNKSSVYQLVCYDVRERFQYFLMLLLITIRNMTAYSWDMTYFLHGLLGNILLAFGSEVIVDIFKHFFITRFNGIEHSAYFEFQYLQCSNFLPGKYTLSTNEGRMRHVRRQYGFLPYPLIFLTYRFLSSSIAVLNTLSLGVLFVVWVGLVVFKVVERHWLERVLRWRCKRLLKKMKSPPDPTLYGCANVDLDKVEGVPFPLGPSDRFGHKIL